MANILLNNRFLINDQEPRSELDQPPALAFNVYRPQKDRIMGYALVCDPKAPPRFSSIPYLQKLEHNIMPTIYDWDTVSWPAENRKCPIIIFEAPNGPKLFLNSKSVIKPIQEDYLSEHFLLPALHMLENMHAERIYHHAIRADNLFYDSANLENIMLGECVSSPPGMAQPILYETVGNSLTPPSGRASDSSTDLYMLGITLAALATGKVPCMDMSDQDIIKAKMSQGSYNVIVGHERLSLSLMEALRGLLDDDPEERWSLELFKAWAEGKRGTPKQPQLHLKATKSLRFAGSEYYSPIELADAFHKYWEQAVPNIRSSGLNQWVRRHLEDVDLLENLQLATGGNAVAENSDYDRALCRIITALHPEGPIRYRQFSCHISAFANYLAYNLKEAEIGTYFKMILQKQVLQYFFSLPGKGQRYFKDANRIERYRLISTRNNWGQGIERVAYEFSPDIPCQSPLLEREYVLRPRDLLPALNHICSDENRKIDFLIDRDIAAFIVARGARNDFDVEIGAFDIGLDTMEGRIAQINLLAKLQTKYNDGVAYFDLARVALNILLPALEKFNNRDTRLQIEDRLKRTARLGQLQAMVHAVNNRKELDEDKLNFNDAQTEYAHITYNLVTTLHDIINKAKIAEDMGSQISSVISSGVAIITLLIGSLIWVLL